MTKKLYEETNIQNIATAIRNKANTTTRYKVSEMAEAINGIETGGGSKYSRPFHYVKTVGEAYNLHTDSYYNFVSSLQYDFDQKPTYINDEITVYCPSTRSDYAYYYNNVIIRKQPTGKYSAVWIPEPRNQLGSNGLSLYTAAVGTDNTIGLYSIELQMQYTTSGVTNTDLDLGRKIPMFTLMDVTTSGFFSSSTYPCYYSSNEIYDLDELITKLRNGTLSYNSLTATVFGFTTMTDDYNLISVLPLINYAEDRLSVNQSTSACFYDKSIRLAKKVNIKSISEK